MLVTDQFTVRSSGLLDTSDIRYLELCYEKCRVVKMQVAAVENFCASVVSSTNANTTKPGHQDSDPRRRSEAHWLLQVSLVT